MRPGIFRVVFDTNTFVSAFVFGGTPAEAYGYVISRTIELAISPPILQEISGVLIKKIGWQEDKTERALKQIIRMATIVRSGQRLAVIEDEPDNRVLEAAIEARADLIVSGDKDLLKIGEFEGIEIITARELVSRIRCKLG